MISREDMLELTRRMTPARTSITRIAGCYVDRDGEFDGSFNTNFLKLSGSDKARNLKLAKAVPFSDTNQNLIKYEFSAEAQKPGSKETGIPGGERAVRGDEGQTLYTNCVYQQFFL